MNGIDNWTLLAIAVGLAMDAFAVATTTGIQLPRVTLRHNFRLAWHFGFFQALNTVIGWTGGLAVRSLIDAFDHWVAFSLLLIIGGKMIHEAFWGKENCEDRDPTRGFRLILLSVATSIDALAVGLSLSLLHISIWVPALVIGLVALIFTTVGLHLGHAVGCRLPLGKTSDLLGGIVLIAIGIHILFEHGVFSGL